MTTFNKLSRLKIKLKRFRLKIIKYMQNIGCRLFHRHTSYKMGVPGHMVFTDSDVTIIGHKCYNNSFKIYFIKWKED